MEKVFSYAGKRHVQLQELLYSNAWYVGIIIYGSHTE